MIAFAPERLMELEVESRTGAERGEGGKAGCRRHHDVRDGGEAALFWDNGHG